MTIIEARTISKSFNGHQVLKGVSLSVEQGERVVILGRSGSGKSTLLRCFNGLARIDGGGLRVAGVDLSVPSPDLRKLRRKVGIVFQSFNLFPHLTVERNVTLALRKVLGKTSSEATGIALAALNQVGLGDKIAAYPSQLSGGQQQRVAIARSLALAPSLMLFDEITSALDPELIGEVVGVLERLAGENMTMVIVTHQLGFARSIANRIVFLHEGKIVEDGSSDAVMNMPRTPELKSFLSAVLT